MVDINKVPIFTQEVFHFTLPNFEEWKKQIYQIILMIKIVHVYTNALESQVA